jgi:hypothetical protein
MSRLETITCALLPAVVTQIYKLPHSPEAITVILKGAVAMAAIVERAIADEELHQMSRPPPKPGDRDG